MAKTSSYRLVDLPLTNIVQGFKQGNFIGESILPIVQVTESAGSVIKFGDEAFRLLNTRRAHLANLNKMDTEGADKTPYELFEDQIEYGYEIQDEVESKFFNLEKKAAKNGMASIQLSKEVEIATMLQDPDNYASTNSVELDDEFLNEAAVDPVEFIQNQMEIVRELTGSYPNALGMSAKVMKYFKFHAKIKSTYFDSNEARRITTAKLSEILEIPNIFVSNAVKITDPATNLKEDIWGNNIILAYVAPAGSTIERDIYEPSFGYTLQMKGHPLVKKYKDNSETFQYINTVEKYKPLILGNTAGFLIQNPIDPAVFNS